MPGRSPHRRSTPPPPLISRHSPPRGRIHRSPDRHLDTISTSRGRERREYRPTVRRSRSPVASKVRSFSPPLKRKASPNREREIARRSKICKSPVNTRGGSEHLSYIAPVKEPDTHTVRTMSESERFRERDYEGDQERALPQFRGPEGSVNFDLNELKKFTIEIIRKPTGVNDETIINRNITNPDEIVPVRRPGMRGSDRHNSGQTFPWVDREEFTFNHQNEGARPLFLRAESSATSSKDRSAPTDDYRRIVAIDSSRVSGSLGREHSHEKTRYSPGPYEENRRTYYPERVHSPYESRHRSPVREREEYVEPREKPRERRANSREILRRDVDVRRREERRYSLERVSYERDSDLRARINEKRSEPHVREEREHSSRRYDSDKERHGRPHYSPVSRERKRAGSVERHEGSRSTRGEHWEREGGERRRRHSREREDRGRDRYEHSDHYEEKRPPSYKSEYEPKKFYRNYEEKEFVPLSNRGRGGPPIRRGIPPIMRGRGMVRGMNRGFRGGIMVPRGVPRVPPFMGMRGFPPRFFPPY